MRYEIGCLKIKKERKINMELLVFMGFFALLAGIFTLWAYNDYRKMQA